MFDRQKIAATVRDAAHKAGILVTAALGIACAAFLVAAVALVMVLKVRRAG